LGFYELFENRRLKAAHRGRRARRPENTLAAFEAAVGHGDFWELDLQLSRDGEWIVIHDETLERTTDIEAREEGLRPYRVRDYDLASLRRLDAGSWFVREDPFGTLAQDATLRRELQDLPPQQLPTPAEVAKLARRYRVPLNLEIKDMPHRDAQEVARSFLRMIASFDGSVDLLVSSFNHRYLAALHALDPVLCLAANIEGSLPPDLPEYLRRCGAKACHVDLPLAWKLPLDELRAAGITCGVFTVNDIQTQALLYDRGFRAIFCDGI